MASPSNRVEGGPAGLGHGDIPIMRWFVSVDLEGQQRPQPRSLGAHEAGKIPQRTDPWPGTQPAGGGQTMIGRLSTFRRGFVSTFGLDVIARGISALSTVMFIRTLPVDSFAYLVLFLNVGQFAGSALTGGVRMRYMRAEAERVSRGHREATGFAPAIFASLVMIFAVAVVAVAGTTLSGIGGSSTDRWLFPALTAAYTAGHASVELAMYHFQAHLKFTRAGFVGIARSVAILAVAVAAAFGAIEAGALIAAITAIAVLAVAIVVCAPLVWESMETPLAAALGGSFGREAGWLTVYYLASAGFAYADIFVVASFLDDSAVASYGAALRYAAIILGPMPALLAVMRVRTSQRDLVDSAHLQTRLLADWIKRSIVPVGAVIGLAALAAPLVIPLLDGGRYPDSIPIFQIMLVPALVNYTTMPGPNLLMTQKRYRLLGVVYVMALIVQLAVAGAVAELSGVIAVAAVASLVGSIETGGVAYLATRLPATGKSVAEPAT